MEHPLRAALQAELHSRPAIPVTAPARVLHLVLFDPDRPDAARQAIIAVCAAHALPPPASTQRQATFALGDDLLYWEQHGEFGQVMLVQRLADTPSRQWPAAVPEIVQSLLDACPSARLAAGDLLLLHEPNAALLGAGAFPSDDLALSRVSDGTAEVATDFGLDERGFTRFLAQARRLSPARAGRLVRRLVEIDGYRMLALLALPVMRQTVPGLAAVERDLARLLDRMATVEGAEAERQLLEELTRMAREVERIAQAQSFRFAAGRAYYALVVKRLDELREEPVDGYQGLATYLERRLGPAMATCKAIADRQATLAERVERATALLRTRVEVALHAQNQALLVSMDRRANLQLRLQETVEGLSVVAISYYALGILAKMVEPLAHRLLHLDPLVLEAGLAPLVVLAVWLGLRRIKRRVHEHG